MRIRETSLIRIERGYMPNFMYPRTISIKRASFGQNSTDGLNQGETVVVPAVPGLPASIQLKRNRSSTTILSPGHTNADDSMPTWKIFFKAANGLVKKGDKITDDLGISYIVEGPYWNSLGYGLEARVYTP